ncbi:MAG: DUF3225 domain-containing protein [Verrucomicrobia bacterium]|nr:DUF3225 domain-containing protein [Verrucomicrobiota bacterium]
MPSVNDPAVIAELTARHDLYERALAAHDLATLNDFFWDSPHVIRYGVSEHLYGSAAIVAYRQNAAAAPFTDRRLLRREIVAFGSDTASVMCEIAQLVGGQPRHSRQSQTWVRFPEVGWKIVAAHVSHALTAPTTAAADWDAYATHAAGALGLPLAPAHRPGVVQNLQRTAALAAPLLAFALPGDAELAPVFTP